MLAFEAGHVKTRASRRLERNHAANCSTALTAACLTALLFGGCGGDTSGLFYSGSRAGSGGLSASGASSGGSSNTGGRATGGKAGGGGAANGGREDAGGEDAGGSASGGTDTGGSSSGGREATGGKSSGGALTGGKASGGAPTGGSATGGVKPSTGGSGGATGGTNTGGVATCSETDGSDVRVQGTSKGLNGSFTDECENGALVEYYCETLAVVDPSCLQVLRLRAAPPIWPRRVPSRRVRSTPGRS